MWSDLLKVLFKRQNIIPFLSVLLVHYGLFGAGWLVIRPHLHKRPCVVCGRANTRPVPTLWQYRDGVVPYCKDVRLWYCRRHIDDAPEIVTQRPSTKDTIPKRFTQAIMAGSIQLVLVLVTLLMSGLPMYILGVCPLVVLITFLLMGVTATATISVLFASALLIPAGIFWAWHKMQQS